MKRKSEESYSDNKGNDCYGRKECYIIFWIIDIELCPESCLGKYCYKNRKISGKSSDTEFRVEDNSKNSKNEHESCEFDSEGKSHYRSDYKDICEIFVVSEEL